LQAASEDDIRLTPTSFIVMGFLAAMTEATPYELKQAVAASVGNFWTLQHAQLYSEPERLARAGFLTEKREQTGRRRKRYRLTARGRRALEDWLRSPVQEVTELRDLALLKLFFGAEPGVLAPTQLEAHRRKLAEYEGFAGQEMPRGVRLALESGLGHEREWVRFWEEISRRGD
jgi:PadR family transcriptional regulator, regulatory protein AphA